MSEVSDYANRLNQESHSDIERGYSPLNIQGRFEYLNDIQVAVFDVYGTIMDTGISGFSETDIDDRMLLTFRKTADEFGLTNWLEQVNPADPPDKTLRDFYNGLLRLKHDRLIDKDIAFPEVRVEEVWEMIIAILMRHGFKPEGDIKTFSRKAAYFYNFYMMRRELYPGVTSALKELKEKNIRCGIIADGQFYTPLDISFAIRRESRGVFNDIYELFDPELVHFSYEHQASKRNPKMFSRLYDTLYELEVLPSQTLYVGNDLIADISQARESGMKTAMFCGDSSSCFLHDQEEEIAPDITFSLWDELADILYFTEKGKPA